MVSDSNIKLIVLKLSYMLASLMLVQATYILMSANTFLIFNNVIFCMGLVTCLTYSQQVKIWRGEQLNREDLYYALMIILVISLAYILFKKYDVFVLSIVTVYLFYRYIERIAFAHLIKKGAITNAYLVSVSLMIVEVACIILFIAIARENNELLVRFLYPSLIVLLAIYIFYHRRLRKYFSRSKENTIDRSSASDSILLNFHSLLLLLVVMSDRIVIDLISIDTNKNALYLLIFSYASALYGLSLGVLDARRPTFLATASSSPTLNGYLRSSAVKKAYVTTSLIFVFLSLGFIVFNSLFPIIDANGLSMFWIPLSCFFFIFHLVAYLHIYLIEKKYYFLLVTSWLSALIIKLFPLLMPNLAQLDIYMTNSIAAGLIMLVVIFAGCFKNDFPRKP